MGKAIFKQRAGILGVGIVGDCGIVTPSQLIALGRLGEEIGCQGMKFTTRQTLLMLIPEEKLPYLQEQIEKTGLQIGVFGNIIRNVKGCCGDKNFCYRTKADAFSLGVEIQRRYINQPVPKDFKISTAGCARGCTDPYCADFGVIGTGEDAFDIYIGGRGGSKNPVHAQLLVKDVNKESVFLVLDHVLTVYRLEGKQSERLCSTIERIGFEKFLPPEAAIIRSKKAIEESDFFQFLNN